MPRLTELTDPNVRAAYTTADEHAAPFGLEAREQTTSLFWRTIGRGLRWAEPATPVLKILTSEQLEALIEAGEIPGAPVDVADGFVHLSTPAQVDETVARHFEGQSGLWVLELDAAALGAALRWEPSRGGALFPHLYAPLRLSDVWLARPWVYTVAEPAPQTQPNNPLHGVTLQVIVEALVARHGWEGLAERVPVKCFQQAPSVSSSLKFLRKTPWARAKVEALYIELARKQKRNQRRAAMRSERD